MQMALMTPAFQPYSGESGKAWMASEYGITGIPADNSSLMSSTSGTERNDTDEEILSFELGPEPFEFRLRAHPRRSLRLLPLLSAQEEAGAVASGAPLKSQLLVWELEKRNSTQQKPCRQALDSHTSHREEGDIAK